MKGIPKVESPFFDMEWFAQESEEIRNAVKSYVEEVKNEKFPAIENEFQMDEDEYSKLRKEIV